VEPSSDDDGSVVAFRTGSATYAAAPGLHAGMVRNLAASTTKAVPPTCHAPAPPCVPDVVSGPELDGAGARVVMGVSEAPYDGYSDTAEMIRLGNGQELFHVANDWRVPEVAISRDGRVLATSNQQGDFIPIGGARGSECLDDPDDTGDIALTGNGGAIAFLLFSTVSIRVIHSSPDAGGVERARFFATKMGAPLAIVDKRRTDINVTEVMNVIGDVRGRTCLIIDDIVDTAGTLVKTAHALLDEGATEVYACASHPVLSGPAVERIATSRIKELVVTNSIPLCEEAKAVDKIKVLSIAGLLGAAIESIHMETSVSSLFN